MEKKNSNRTRLIGLRLTPAEYLKVEQQWKASTCRKLSDYVRRHLFNKPISTTYRNSSMDDLMTELAKVREELNHIGINFNQAVKRLHSLNQIAEFRQWLIAYELEKKILHNKIEEIKKQILKIAEKW